MGFTNLAVGFENDEANGSSQYLDGLDLAGFRMDVGLDVGLGLEKVQHPLDLGVLGAVEGQDDSFALAFFGSGEALREDFLS